MIYFEDIYVLLVTGEFPCFLKINNLIREIFFNIMLDSTTIVRKYCKSEFQSNTCQFSFVVYSKRLRTVIDAIGGALHPETVNGDAYVPVRDKSLSRK